MILAITVTVGMFLMFCIGYMFGYDTAKIKTEDILYNDLVERNK